ncbi:MAG TPA: acyl-CoA dehydrogenase [Cyclobacteriaceae bacterium]
MKKHPSVLFEGQTIAVLRNEALEAEKLGCLTDKQLAVIHSQKWFRFLIPARYNGLALTLPEILRVEEGLSWIDGSVGWVVTLCSGAAWFVGFGNQEFIKTFIDDKDLCIAGSGAVGIAERERFGFRISGSWKYASGALHATVFTVNCMDLETQEVSSFFLLPNEVTVRRTWNAMGMIATGSHSFEVKDKLIGADRQFIIEPEHAVLKDPVYQYPFLPLAEATLAVNISGMALRFIELSETYGAKSMVPFPRYREVFFDVTDKNLLSKVSIVSHDLVKASRDIVNDLYSQCGLSAANKESEINRVWRNFHTAVQHSLFQKKL